MKCEKHDCKIWEIKTALLIPIIIYTSDIAIIQSMVFQLFSGNESIVVWLRSCVNSWATITESFESLLGILDF